MHTIQNQAVNTGDGSGAAVTGVSGSSREWTVVVARRTIMLATVRLADVPDDVRRALHDWVSEATWTPRGHTFVTFVADVRADLGEGEWYIDVIRTGVGERAHRADLPSDLTEALVNWLDADTRATATEGEAQ